MSESDPVSREAELDLMLMSRLRNGDPVAMEELICRFGPSLNRLIGRLMSWDSDCDDILQEVFLTAWKKASAFDARGSLEGWLRTLVVNRCRNHHRARDAFQRMLGRAACLKQPSNQVSSRSTLNDLELAMAKLKRDDRAILVLFYLESMNGEEVANTLGVKIETVHVKLHRARQRLREILKTGDGSNGSR